MLRALVTATCFILPALPTFVHAKPVEHRLDQLVKHFAAEARRKAEAPATRTASAPRTEDAATGVLIAQRR